MPELGNFRYQVNKPAPTEEDVKSFFAHLLALTAQKPGTLVALRKYLGKWACWLKSGISTLTEFGVWGAVEP